MWKKLAFVATLAASVGAAFARKQQQTQREQDLWAEAVDPVSAHRTTR